MIKPAHIAEVESALHKKIRSIADSSPQTLSDDKIGEVVREVLATITGDVTAADLKFYAEIEELATYIHHAKQEIADIKPKEISASHIPHATDELDAVVGATEEATNKIMDQCDVISTLASTCPPETNQQLVDCTTRIFEACNFQDITGQRITKVVQTLKYIDGKIAALMRALGEELGREEIANLNLDDPEKALLNGPQLPHKAIDQSEIDKLLSGES